MIEYYTSTLNPDCFWAAVDNVMVAIWWETRWVDKGTYRPVRNHYQKVEWTKKPYDLKLIFDLPQFERVKTTGHESYQ